MDNDTFWDLIEGSRRRTPDSEERLTWLREQLVRLPLPEIVQFQVCLDQARRPVDTWDMWAAAAQILDGFCSDDSFWYFQVWVIGLGRAAYEAALADPDSLAEVPELQRLAGRDMDTWADHEWPDWECLEYVAGEAFEELTGEEEGLENLLDAEDAIGLASPEPTGEHWSVRDRAQAAVRLPRLSKLFPLTEAAG